MKRFGYILLVVMLALGVGCERRELVDPDSSALLRVIIRTENIPNVTEGIYNPDVEIPSTNTESMRVLMYSKNEGRLLSQGFLNNRSINAEGNQTFSGNLRLGPGEYSMVGYNFDAANTIISDEINANTIKAYTSEISAEHYARVGSRADELDCIYYQPDMLFVSRDMNLNIDSHTGVRTIEAEAHPVVDTYYIQIRVKGVEYIAVNAAASAVITGMSPSNLIGQGLRNEEQSCGIYFEMNKGYDQRIRSKDNEVLCAVFNTFGKIEDASSDLTITMRVLTRDGKVHEKEVDMNPIFETEDARLRHWLLIEEVWELPKPVTPPSTGGGGFQPVVDDWDDVQADIPIKPAS